MATNFIPKIQWLNVTKLGDISTGTATILNLPSTSDLQVGMIAKGTGIPSGAKILTVDSSTQVTLDANATATTVALSIEFYFEFVFTYPPVDDDNGKTATAEVKEDTSISGIRQIMYNHTEEVRNIFYRFLTLTETTTLRTFFDTHGKFAYSFRYFTHSTETPYVEYELKTFEFDAKRIFPKGGDFLYELPLVLRRAY